MPSPCGPAAQGADMRGSGEPRTEDDTVSSAWARPPLGCWVKETLLSQLGVTQYRKRKPLQTVEQNRAEYVK